MRTLTCQIVRPDKLLYEGKATSVILKARSGEIGVFPGHAAEICALGDGIMRIALPEGGEGPSERRVVISGGYAEVADDVVIVLATHARNIDDIEPEVVQRTRDKAVVQRDRLPKGDHGRAYYDDKVRWCDLLARASEKAAEAR